MAETANIVCQGRIDPALIPDYTAHSIAQIVFRPIVDAWNDPEIQKRYRRWKEERRRATPESV